MREEAHGSRESHVGIFLRSLPSRGESIRRWGRTCPSKGTLTGGEQLGGPLAPYDSSHMLVRLDEPSNMSYIRWLRRFRAQNSLEVALNEEALAWAGF